MSACTAGRLHLYTAIVNTMDIVTESTLVSMLKSLLEGAMYERAALERAIL